MREGRFPTVVLSDVAELEVRYAGYFAGFLTGLRLLFSFHQDQALPRRVNHVQGVLGGWNCSVPWWPDFRLHLMCNRHTECAGGEDEASCPDSSCRGVNESFYEGVQIRKNCYVSLPGSVSYTWIEARTACRQKGLELATFPTIGHWYHVTLLAHIPGFFVDTYYFIGLVTAASSLPHMYKYQSQWLGGALAHYYLRGTFFAAPNCGRIFRGKPLNVIQNNCDDRSRSFGAPLCQGERPVDPVLQVGATDVHYGPEKPPFSGTGIHLKQANSSPDGLPILSTHCRHGHFTHKFLTCDTQSSCWFDSTANQGHLDERHAREVMITLSCDVTITSSSFTVMFVCGDGIRYVPYSLVCDHLSDCADNSDEIFCVFPVCALSTHFQCYNQQCVQAHFQCDGLVHCIDGSDETDCELDEVATSYRSFAVLPPMILNFDGRGSAIRTHIDRKNRSLSCPDTHFFCPGDEICMPVYVICNDVKDCPGHEDEDGCDTYSCPGFYRCRGSQGICLHPAHICDGWPQCPQHDDERFCNITCPKGCECLGHAFTCRKNIVAETFPDLRYLDAEGSGLATEHLSKNEMLVYLNLANCGLVDIQRLSLSNIRSLDISSNRIRVISVDDFKGMKNLRTLSIANNPVEELFSNYVANNQSDLHSLLHVDLSGIKLREIVVRKSLPFPNLLYLNLSHSGIEEVLGDNFQSLPSLATVDLRGCPLTYFTRDLFAGLKNLKQVYTDNYKLCCPAMFPSGFPVDSCKAPFDEISSCDALLRSDVYRVGLSVLATLALVGNLGCGCVRLIVFKHRTQLGFHTFVVHLCLSDFLMGVYLSFIGVADRVYQGTYLWEDSSWRHSVFCNIAGFLSLLSSEVSSIVICLITLERFLVIRFPFSQFRFKHFSAQVTCLLMWLAGLLLAGYPLLPVSSRWKFYSHNGICIPLPITRLDFEGYHYALGVMILFNLFLSILIATGQVSIYVAMVTNAIASLDSSRKSQDLVVARRLVTVVVSNLCCWLPIGLLGILASQSVAISSEFNVGIAIFLLPLNAALNPYLYTLNVLRERRRQARDRRLVKLIGRLAGTPS